MCSHYQGLKDRDRYRRHFGVEPPADLGKFDMWPGYPGSFIRRHPHANVGDEAVPERETLTGLFGLLPHWTKDTRITRQTYNARSETVATKPSFRDAWKRGQFCIIPAEAIFEPDWRSGRPVPARIALADGAPMGIAGLWTRWQSPQGEVLHSYTMLTINAAEHALMRQFYKPADEKRMVVILPVARYADWLQASPERGRALLRMFPAKDLSASASGRARRPEALASASKHVGGRRHRLIDVELQRQGAGCAARRRSADGSPSGPARPGCALRRRRSQQ
jgi:putative SOS response-associated peptidase YedK